jgi:uncharacterized protein YggE
MRTHILLAGLFAAALIAPAQTRRPFISTTGNASVSANADQITVVVTTSTQATTAQEATSQNATKISNILAALRKLLGANGDIKTLNVNVNPVTRNNNQQVPQIVAYIASSSLQVTVSQAATAGAVIDTATQTGASSVGGLQFGLKDPELVRAQALRLATQQAKAHAEAIAFSLGRSLGSIVSVTETGGTVPRGVFAGGVATTATPVEAGPLEVSASVVMEVELN